MMQLPTGPAKCSNTIPIGNTDCQPVGILTSCYDYQKSTNDSRDQKLNMLPETLRKLSVCSRYKFTQLQVVNNVTI